MMSTPLRLLLFLLLAGLLSLAACSNASLVSAPNESENTGTPTAELRSTVPPTATQSTVSPTPSPSATSVGTVSATPMPVPATAEASPVAGQAHIISFEVTPAQADPGDTVSLRWEAVGDRAVLCPSSRYVLFTSDDCREVSLSGAQAYVIPQNVNGNPYIEFLLTVSAASSTMTQQTQVAMKCRQRWFFSNETQAGVCPLDPIHSHAAAQHLEHGSMIWLKEAGRYFILEDRNVAPGDIRRPLTTLSDPLDIVRNTEGEVMPPAGLVAPTSGFGLIWRGDVSQSSGFRDQLGWAFQPEFGYQATYQCDDATPSGGRVWQTCYLNAPDGQIIALLSTGAWYWRDEQTRRDTPSSVSQMSPNLFVQSDCPMYPTGYAGPPQPVRSPDGQRLAAAQTDPDLGAWLDVAKSDGSERVRIEPPGRLARIGLPAWSPDSRRLAFANYALSIPGGGDIYVVGADGSGLTRLVSFTGFYSRLAWSPDGLQLAYTSGENIGQGSGHRVVGHKVYVISVDGTGDAQLASEGCEPVWLP